MDTAGRSRNRNNLHHRATETRRKQSQQQNLRTRRWRRPRRRVVPGRIAVARMAATKMKRPELLENLCSARRFPTLVVCTRIGKKMRLGLICVIPSPSAALNVCFFFDATSSKSRRLNRKNGTARSKNVAGRAPSRLVARRERPGCRPAGKLKHAPRGISFSLSRRAWLAHAAGPRSLPRGRGSFRAWT
jgi:hypothetical protein